MLVRDSLYVHLHVYIQPSAYIRTLLYACAHMCMYVQAFTYCKHCSVGAEAVIAGLSMC